MTPVTLQTSRLILRQWTDQDLPAFAAMNADDSVMRYFPSFLTATESNTLANKIRQLIADRGWGIWAISRQGLAEDDFIGFVGLHVPSYDLPFMPCTEIGWRLHKDHWGQGYATEAAKEALRYAFEQLHLPEVVSFTAIPNLPSQAVMTRIGMVNKNQNFHHPAIAPNHYLSEHVLFAITRQQWLTQNMS